MSGESAPYPLGLLNQEGQQPPTDDEYVDRPAANYARLEEQHDHEPLVGVPVQRQPLPVQPALDYVVNVAGMPNYGQPGHLPRGIWSDGLCDFSKSLSICLLSCCFAPFQWAQNMERVNFYSFAYALLIYGVPGVFTWIMHALFRSTHDPLFSVLMYASSAVTLYIATSNRIKLREHYQIQGSACEDCLVHTFCGCCAIAQEGRHIARDHAIPL